MTFYPWYDRIVLKAWTLAYRRSDVSPAVVDYLTRKSRPFQLRSNGAAR